MDIFGIEPVLALIIISTIAILVSLYKILVKLEHIDNALSVFMPRREEVREDARDIENVLKDILEIKIAE